MLQYYYTIALYENMIYLIGGTPRCGKSTLAARLGHSWISADTIESIVSVNITDPEERKKFFPKNALRVQTAYSNDEMYAKFTDKEITNAYIAQSKTSFPHIKMLIECTLREDRDFVIEGHQLQPKLIDELQSLHGKENIKSLTVVRTDTDIVLNGCLNSNKAHDWFHEKTTDPATYRSIAEMIALYGAYLKKESEKYDLPVIEMHDTFESDLKTATNLILN